MEHFAEKRINSDCKSFKIADSRFEKIRMGCEKEVWTQNRERVRVVYEMIVTVRQSMEYFANAKPALQAEVDRPLPTLTGEEDDMETLEKRLEEMNAALKAATADEGNDAVDGYSLAPDAQTDGRTDGERKEKSERET